MAKIAILLLGLAQSPFIHCHPAGHLIPDSNFLAERGDLDIPSIQPTTSYSTAIETLQSVPITILPSITGSIPLGLPSGGFTNNPLKPGGTVTDEQLYPAETPLDPGPTEPLNPISENIFQPIATGLPPPPIRRLGGHYVKKQHIVDEDVPIQTNKFYANFFLGGQGNPVWTHPYHLAWSKGTGQTRSYGMAVSHTERNQFAFGPREAGNKPQYFIAPLGINHMVLSSAELGRNTVLSVEELKAFSVDAKLAPNATSRPVMTIPCVQGMGLVTAIYDVTKPIISSGVFFRTFDLDQSYRNTATYKWRVTLNDNSRWLFYVTPVGSAGIPTFTLDDAMTISGPRNFKGIIQVAKNPAGYLGEQAFDAAAGAYAKGATVTGSVSGSTGRYSLAWDKGGVEEQTLLMYALPHHVESFDQETRLALKDIRLVTTTKGYAQAVLADRITMIEDDLPANMGFAPWAKNANGSAGGSGNVNLQAGALALVNSAGHAELAQDFVQQTRLNSMYYSGKGLAKFAGIIYTMNSIAGNRELAASGLIKLKDAFNVFVNNTQPEPLVYDTVWKGVVSIATYRPINGGPGDPGLDFGNTLYNDHHFHYGYFVYTAAVIGYLDPTWLDQGTNKAYVNTLVRDFANPVNDQEFPFQRAFDWFHGHSWAKGLFESGDGKDQESTSEDTFATYAVKMWGKIIRDANMEARGNLQLAVQARSMRNYFLMTSDNQNQPPHFLHNKVTGILFENKIDHTTYFGSNIEYIEGIHMIPLNPSSAYTRSRRFVIEEWNAYFSDGRINNVKGGWKAILYANLALIDPKRAYEFFADPNFDTQLDGGASRTWYLAYTAALLNADNGVVEQDPNLRYHNAESAVGTKPSKGTKYSGDRSKPGQRLPGPDRRPSKHSQRPPKQVLRPPKQGQRPSTQGERPQRPKQRPRPNQRPPKPGQRPKKGSPYTASTSPKKVWNKVKPAQYSSRPEPKGSKAGWSKPKPAHYRPKPAHYQPRPKPQSPKNDWSTPTPVAPAQPELQSSPNIWLEPSPVVPEPVSAPTDGVDNTEGKWPVGFVWPKGHSAPSPYPKFPSVEVNRQNGMPVEVINDLPKETWSQKDDEGQATQQEDDIGDVPGGGWTAQNQELSSDMTNSDPHGDLPRGSWQFTNDSGVGEEQEVSVERPDMSWALQDKDT